MCRFENLGAFAPVKGEPWPYTCNLQALRTGEPKVFVISIITRTYGVLLTVAICMDEHHLYLNNNLNYLLKRLTLNPFYFTSSFCNYLLLVVYHHLSIPTYPNSYQRTLNVQGLSQGYDIGCPILIVAKSFGNQSFNGDQRTTIICKNNLMIGSWGKYL